MLGCQAVREKLVGKKLIKKALMVLKREKIVKAQLKQTDKVEGKNN